MPQVDLGKVTLTSGEQAKLDNFAFNASSELESSAPLIELMEGYSFTPGSNDPTYGTNVTDVYAGVVRNGNKLTLVISGTVVKPSSTDLVSTLLGKFEIPLAIANKLIPDDLNSIDEKLLYLPTSITNTGITKPGRVSKTAGENKIYFWVYNLNGNDVSSDATYYFRYEATFLLCDNMVSD